MINSDSFAADLLILDIYSTNFEDEGVELIIKKFKNLTHLNIGNIEITDKTIDLIFKTDEHLKNLKELSIANSQRLSKNSSYVIKDNLRKLNFFDISYI
jgi:hypothetical protein